MNKLTCRKKNDFIWFLYINNKCYYYEQKLIQTGNHTLDDEIMVLEYD